MKEMYHDFVRNELRHFHRCFDEASEKALGRTLARDMHATRQVGTVEDRCEARSACPQLHASCVPILIVTGPSRLDQVLDKLLVEVSALHHLVKPNHVQFQESRIITT